MIKQIHESWKPLFLNIIEKDLFREIDFLDYDTIYPKREDVFKVFEMPLSDIRVVILAQDPYIKKDQCIGLAFAVPEDIAKPPSLKAVEKEVGHELDRTLKPWTEQGVFLLNTALTVERGKSGSHIGLWHEFTKKVIQYISEYNPCIWMLWGKYAQDYTQYIQNYVYEYPKLDEGEHHKNVILVAAHPAAESYKANAGFYGSNNFNQANKVLDILQKKKINW